MPLRVASGFFEYIATAFASDAGRFLTSIPMEATPDLPSSSMLSRRNRSTEFRTCPNPRGSVYTGNTAPFSSVMEPFPSPGSRVYMSSVLPNPITSVLQGNLATRSETSFRDSSTDKVV